MAPLLSDSVLSELPRRCRRAPAKAPLPSLALVPTAPLPRGCTALGTREYRYIMEDEKVPSIPGLLAAPPAPPSMVEYSIEAMADDCRRIAEALTCNRFDPFSERRRLGGRGLVARSSGTLLGGSLGPP